MIKPKQGNIISFGLWCISECNGLLKKRNVGWDLILRIDCWLDVEMWGNVSVHGFKRTKCLDKICITTRSSFTRWSICISIIHNNVCNMHLETSMGDFFSFHANFKSHNILLAKSIFVLRSLKWLNNSILFVNIMTLPTLLEVVLRWICKYMLHIILSITQQKWQQWQNTYESTRW